MKPFNFKVAGRIVVIFAANIADAYRLLMKIYPDGSIDNIDHDENN